MKRKTFFLKNSNSNKRVQNILETFKMNWINLDKVSQTAYPKWLETWTKRKKAKLNGKKQ